jgi:hypothetical protein
MAWRLAEILVNLVLQRISDNGIATQGTLALPGGPVLQTLELPWISDPLSTGGMHNMSCVPRGTYDLVLHDTPTHPKTFALSNPQLGVVHEPDPAYPNARVACLIHVANFPGELEGCIGLGLNAGENCVWESADALASFKVRVPWVIGNTLQILPVPIEGA